MSCLLFHSVVINWQNSARSLTLDLADVGFTSATADDLLFGISLGRLTNSWEAISRWWLVFSKKKYSLPDTLPMLTLTAWSFSSSVIALWSHFHHSLSTTRQLPKTRLREVLAFGLSHHLSVSSASLGMVELWRSITSMEENLGRNWCPWITSTPISFSRTLYAPTVVTHSLASMEVIQVQMPISGQVSIEIEILWIDGMNDWTELGWRHLLRIRCITFWF